MAHASRFVKNYGLSIVLTILFLASWLGQGVAQWKYEQAQAHEHNQTFTTQDFLPSFWASTFENWQSEFLQLLTFVVLTSFLIHRGSHESKDSDDELKKQLDRIESKLGQR